MKRIVLPCVVGALIFFGTGALMHLPLQISAQPRDRPPADPLAQQTNDGPRPHFSYMGTRMHQAVGDPTAGLVREVRANPENDIAKARLIERERQGIEDGE